MAANPGHSVPRLFADPYAVKATCTYLRPRDSADKEEPGPTNVPSQRGSLPVRGRPLFELGDPYFEADEVLGEFAGRAHLHQFFYTRSVDLSLSLCYLLRAFDGYGVKIIHGTLPS